jgi:hypothetical protein
MGAPRLIFLGASSPEAPLRWEGRELLPGTAIELCRRRSPWKPGQEVERVIIGSHPTRADVLLEGPGIRPEHVRVYLPRGDGPADLRPLQEGAARLGGLPIAALAWTPLRGGEEVELGAFRFRYEVTAPCGEALA